MSSLGGPHYEKSLRIFEKLYYFRYIGNIISTKNISLNTIDRARGRRGCRQHGNYCAACDANLGHHGAAARG